MPRKTNATKKSATTKSKKTSRSTEKKVVAAAAAAPVTNVVEKTTVVPEQVESAFKADFDKLGQLTQRLNESNQTSKRVVSDLRKLVSAISRYEKKTLKTSRRRTTNRNVQSGITRPVHISDALCSFLSVERGTLMARTEVTRRIIAYVRDHNLQNPDNRKQIFPDSKLQPLLQPLLADDREKGYTFFNLQRYLKHNYQKVEASTGKGAKKSTGKGASA